MVISKVSAILKVTKNPDIMSPAVNQAIYGAPRDIQHLGVTHNVSEKISGHFPQGVTLARSSLPAHPWIWCLNSARD